MPHFVPDDLRTPLPDFPMSTYKFVHEEGERTVSSSFKAVYCPDIVENFYLFMLGCGFSAKNVLDGMNHVIEDYSPVALDVD